MHPFFLREQRKGALEANGLKQILKDRCVPVNFAKSLRTPILKNISR